MFITNGVFGLDYEEHGGHCCGVMHLNEFPTVAGHPELRALDTATRSAKIKLAMNDAIADSYDAEDMAAHVARYPGAGILFEVVITDAQIMDWQEALEGAGFKKVVDFVNANSGNRCHMFLGVHVIEGE